MRRLIAIAFLFSASQAWALSFGFYSPFTIDHTKVPSTQTDFPVLLIGQDNRFKTVGNGGHVQNSSGFDIRPYSDSGLTSALTYELVYYKPATGEFEMWIKESSLSSSSDTLIYMAYGEASLTTDGSSTATWSNSFLVVYHLKDGTTLSVADSVGAAATTNHGATAATGKIDGGGGFVAASTQYITDNAGYSASAITYSAWVNATSFPGAYNSIICRDSTPSLTLLAVKSNGKIFWGTSTASAGTKSYDGTGSHTLSTGTWYYLVGTYDTSAGLAGYVNAASDATLAGGSVIDSPSISPDIGRQTSVVARYWNGTIDEARIASVARSANWITTEYNNQSAPGTFETLGTEVSLTTTANGWFYFFP